MKPSLILAVTFLVSGCQSLTSGSQSTTKSVSVNGTTLTYQEQGTGTPVVFLHGAFSDHRIWEPQREVVAAKHRFIALSMRYFGTTSWPDNGTNFSLTTHAADVAAFIRELKLGPVVLVGRSYGASTAIVTALRSPELIQGLFLNEPGLASAVTDPTDRANLASAAKALEAVRESVKVGNNAEATRRFFDYVNAWPGGFDTLPPTTQTMHLDNARTVPLQLRPGVGVPVTCAELGQIKVPVTLTKGEITRQGAKVVTEAVSRCIPGAQLLTVPGARHAAPSQNASVFNAALLVFLERR